MLRVSCSQPLRRSCIRAGFVGVALWLVLSAAGCGFHLRGTSSLVPELQAPSVEGIARYSDLARALAQVLEARGSRLAESPGKTGARLVVLSESLTRQVLSVDARGNATEYSLRNNVRFELRAADNAELVPAQQIRLQRHYRFDPNQVLAAANEDALIRAEMQRATAEQMIERLNIALTPE